MRSDSAGCKKTKSVQSGFQITEGSFQTDSHVTHTCAYYNACMYVYRKGDKFQFPFTTWLTSTMQLRVLLI